MDRVAAYGVVTAELETLRQLPYDDLVARIGTRPHRREIVTPAGVAFLETSVEWKDRANGEVSVLATFDGPSTWRLERLEERISVER
jgi:hypothetical protein